MPEPPNETGTALHGRRALLTKHPWVTFLLPLVVFMVITGLEPKPADAGYGFYPCIYTVKIALTLLAVWFVLPGYPALPWKVGSLAVAVGVVGAAVWVGLCELKIKQTCFQPALEKVDLGWIITSGARSEYNPMEQLAGQPLMARSFLAVRFFGLVVVAAVIEEMFLRGFLMRFAVAGNWPKVPFGKVNATAVVIGTVFSVLMHPGELLAAAVWFSMVTWLMVKTRSIGDCITAHATTNLLLGIYVVRTGTWSLM